MPGKTMMRVCCVVAGLLLASAPLHAGGTHEGGHSEAEGHGHGHASQVGHGHASFGMPGKASKVARVVAVEMAETDDGAMIFEPSEIIVKEGETVRFALRNAGQLAHEFVLGDSESIQAHKKQMEMADDGGHAHGSGNSLQLKAGASGDLIWQFSISGHFEFACLIPGHYEAGMKGKLHVGGH